MGGRTAQSGMKRNVKLTLEYDGTNYHGWQSQPARAGATIQNTLEQALKTLSGEDLRTHSSGRTDAGVHALGHVASFKTSSTIPSAAWAPALNHLLPPDIRVLASEEVDMDFHARYSALAKTYKYRILCRRAQTALYRNYAWHVPAHLNVVRMRKAIGFFVGRHDFSAFRGAGCSAKSPVRTMKSASIRKTGEFLELFFEADAFLQHMVRAMAGTLVEVGLGRFRPDDIQDMLASRNRGAAGKTAPPQGLYLVNVTYPDIHKT